MSARHDIFTALRRLRPQEFSAETIEARARKLARAMQDSLPPLECSDLCENFIARVTAEKVGATVERLAGWPDLPEAVARYAEMHGLEKEVALQPDPRLQTLDWTVFLRADAPLRPDSMLAVGAARGGIAETGSLVFHSGPEAPTLYGFLPLHHIVALEARTIVARFEDYAAAEQGQPQPRNVNFITGASGTTDIEGVLARGAHGPRRLHILIVG
jgi:L-lactate dehydrogenase complex protein LldG